MFRNLLAGAAVLTMAATPVFAQPAANSAAKLSIARNIPASARSGPEMKNGRKVLGGGILIGLAVVAAVVVGIVLIDGDDDADSN